MKATKQNADPRYQQWLIKNKNTSSYYLNTPGLYWVKNPAVASFYNKAQAEEVLKTLTSHQNLEVVDGIAAMSTYDDEQRQLRKNIEEKLVSIGRLNRAIEKHMNDNSTQYDREQKGTNNPEFLADLTRIEGLLFSAAEGFTYS